LSHTVIHPVRARTPPGSWHPPPDAGPGAGTSAGLVPALGGALWPVTFVVLQVITNVYFARSGFWRILITGA
jgi:hypothetical protein